MLRMGPREILPVLFLGEDVKCKLSGEIFITCSKSQKIRPPGFCFVFQPLLLKKWKHLVLAPGGDSYFIIF